MEEKDLAQVVTFRKKVAMYMLTHVGFILPRGDIRLLQTMQNSCTFR